MSLATDPRSHFIVNLELKYSGYEYIRKRRMRNRKATYNHGKLALVDVYWLSHY